MIPRKYKIKPNDNWISIANSFGVNLDDLLYYNGINPTSKEALPVIQPGQKIYLRDPYRLKASKVKAKAPKDYGDWGSEGQAQIEIYANAVKQGKIDFNDIPEIYQIPVNQRMIAMSQNDFASKFPAADAASMLINPGLYFAMKGAQKTAAYTADAVSGRNEYGLEDLGKYTPILGRENAANNPGLAAITDVALPGLIVGSVKYGSTISPNIKVLPSDVKSTVSFTTGLDRMSLSKLPVHNLTRTVPAKSGSVFTAGYKGFGKTGTVTGSPNTGYVAKVGPKSTFTNSASFIPRFSNEITPYPITTFLESVPLVNGQYPNFVQPFIPPVSETPPIPIAIETEPTKHIYEQSSFNRWQMPNPTGEVVPHQPGTGRFTITGEAPISTTTNRQALTNESLNFWHDYMPRQAVYVPGVIQGTPSNIKSGLGINYDSENPGNLIIE